MIGDPSKSRDPSDYDLEQHEARWNRWANWMQNRLLDTLREADRLRVLLGENGGQIESLKTNASHFRELTAKLEADLRDARSEVVEVRRQRDVLANYVRASERMKDAEAVMREAERSARDALGPAFDALTELDGDGDE